MAEEAGSPPARYEWSLACPPDDVNTALDFLRTIWVSDPSVSAIDRAALETAVVEMTGNVIEHAAAGAAEAECRIVVEIDPAVIRIEVRDDGASIDLDLDGSAMPDDTAESGRGIPMIRALVDEFSYAREGDVNHWHLARSRTAGV